MSGQSQVVEKVLGCLHQVRVGQGKPPLNHPQNVSEMSNYRGGCHAPARPYAPVSKPGLLDEGRVPRGVQGRAGA